MVCVCVCVHGVGGQRLGHAVIDVNVKSQIMRSFRNSLENFGRIFQPASQNLWQIKRAIEALKLLYNVLSSMPDTQHNIPKNRDVKFVLAFFIMPHQPVSYFLFLSLQTFFFLFVLFRV